LTEAEPAGPLPDLPYALLLTALVVVAHLALLPYSTQLVPPAAGAPRMSVPGQAVAALLDVVLSWVLIRVGLRLGPRVGLGWPPIDGWETRASSAERAKGAAVMAALVGAAVALALGIAGAAFERRWPMPPMPTPTPWAAALASLGAGVYEEIWFRLGVMTIFAWLLRTLARRWVTTSAIVWSANLLAALAFGAAHLPLARSLVTLTPPIVTIVLAANGFVGLVCGWLYWRRGLFAAMIAHATTDLVMKVVLPLFQLSS
jgi:hypothetical protein